MEQASILIVEDEAVVALDLKMELEELGYDVVGIADTAVQAIEMARHHRPALTLMDVMLKGDRDGVQAAESLRLDPGTPVVFLTSFSDAQTVQRAAFTGAYGYLTKPFQLKELRAGIEVALWKSRMERRLRESDRWFALTLRCVQDGVVVVNLDGRIRFMNPAAEALLGWPCEEAVGQPLWEVVRLESLQGDAQPLAVLALRERRAVGVRTGRLLPRGAVTSIAIDESAGPIDDERGMGLGAVLVLRDATQREQQQSRLLASEERFRSAFEFAPLGMALVSLDGRFVQVNEALCRLLGCDERWLLQRSQRSVTLPQDTAHEETRLAELQAGPAEPPGALPAVVQFEKRYLHSDGQAVWVLVNASLLHTAGEPACLLYQVHDLTAQKAAAAQLAEVAAERMQREAEAQADRSRAQFLSRVSHEMRTPLNAVLGFAQLMKMQAASGQPLSATYSEHILAAGSHLLALVDDVLDIQRANDGSLRFDLQRTALDDLLPTTVEMLRPMAAPRDISLEYRIEPGLHVRADPTRLRQVLLNFGSNAVKYNRNGGTVRIHAQAHSEAASQVRLRIEDTGMGMTDDQLAHLFEPFNRLGREALPVAGVGLGLVISRKLVEQMGGAVTVERSASGGIVATVDLPMAQEPAS